MLSPEDRAFFMAQRAAQDVVIPLAASSATTVNQIMTIIRDWQPGKHIAGDVRMYDGIPYKCVQAHDSAANPGWTPDTVPALWMQYHGTGKDTARPFLQPQGAHDAYQKDEYCVFEGKTYKSKVSANTYSPKDYAQNWTLV